METLIVQLQQALKQKYTGVVFEYNEDKNNLDPRWIRLSNPALGQALNNAGLGCLKRYRGKNNQVFIPVEVMDFMSKLKRV